MKRRFVIMLLVGVYTLGIVGCGKNEANEPIDTIESSVEPFQESSESNIDKWNGSQSKPSESQEGTQTSSSSEENESEGIESSEPIQTEEHIETNEPIETEEPSSQMVSEEDLVHVVVPEENKGVQDFLYGSADYKVEGDIAIDENIDFGITLDSDDVRKLITLIYEGTGCTSHKVLEEHFAIFDYDENDYSAYIELSDGSKYGIYLVNGRCYAIKDEF